MRLVHISDWHYSFQKLPEADLYVCTGDLLPDFYCTDKYGKSQPRLERIKQYASMAKLQKHGGFRQYLGSPKAPVVCVRGNHDYVELAPLFADCNLVKEFVNNETIEILGMKITGHRGIPWINGGFSDEFTRNALLDRAKKMPVADLYLTHYPPDDMRVDGTDRWHYGLVGMMAVLMYRDHGGRKPLHCFGHVHENGGVVVTEGDLTLSNAATTYNVLEGSPETGWDDVSPA